MYERITKKVTFKISNEIIKYCYKANNYYDFDRRIYFLSLLIENKILKGKYGETNEK